MTHTKEDQQLLTPLQQLVHRLEATAGAYSKSFSALDVHGKKDHIQNIPFALKPAQQLIAALGGSLDPKAYLTTQLHADPDKVKIEKESYIIRSFSFSESDKKKTDNAVQSTHPQKLGNILEIPKKCLENVFASAKIYVNTTIFTQAEGKEEEKLDQANPEEKETLYEKALRLVQPQDETKSEDAQEYWQNLAVGVCHAQKTYLLTATALDEGKGHALKARTVAKVGKIEENETPILVLSTSRLKYKGMFTISMADGSSKEMAQEGLAQEMPVEKQRKFIEGMYRNIFNAAVTENYFHIVLGPAGLGSYGGKTDMYFKALKTVAAEFPNLNIIYAPGPHEKEFDLALRDYTGVNLVKTTKDIVTIADRLNRLENTPCALHNPVSVDSIYGRADIGANWKKGKPGFFSTGKAKEYSFEDFFSAISTAVLNSFGFNKKAFERIVHCKLTSLASSRKSSVVTDERKDNHTVHGSSHQQHNPDDHASAPAPAPASAPAPAPAPASAPAPAPAPANNLPPSDHSHSTTAPAPAPTPAPTAAPAPAPAVATPPIIKPIETGTTVEVAKPPVASASAPIQAPAPAPVPPPTTATTTAPATTASATNPGANKNGVFTTPSKQEAPPPIVKKSSFTTDQQEEIHKVRDQLQKEKDSCWPYPNKDLKGIKIEALDQLLLAAETKSIKEAIAFIREKYPRVEEGTFSCRTAELFERLLGAEPELVPAR